MAYVLTRFGVFPSLHLVLSSLGWMDTHCSFRATQPVVWSETVRKVRARGNTAETVAKKFSVSANGMIGWKSEPFPRDISPMKKRMGSRVQIPSAPHHSLWISGIVGEPPEKGPSTAILRGSRDQRPRRNQAFATKGAPVSGLRFSWSHLGGFRQNR